MDLTDNLVHFLENADHDASKIGLAYRRLVINAGLGGSAVGSPASGMQKVLRQSLAVRFPGHNFNRWAQFNPGDTIRVGPSTTYDITTSMPVNPDIWYLTVGASVLPFTGENYQENSRKILEFIAPYLTRLDNIKPLKSLQKYSDLQKRFSIYEMRDKWRADGVPHVIREMRFETWMLNRNTEFPSAGPKASIEAGVKSTPSTSMGQLYGGLLSFPVGQYGVMEVVSIFSESMIDMLTNEIPFTPDGTVVIQNPTGWKCVTEISLDGMMSPMTDLKGECPGVHLVEKGYVMVSRDAEYPATHFKGTPPILPLQSMRYYLRRDAKWPLPGEFIGLLAKPFPTHVWWFQDTSPLLYSGNWIETNYYTSGVVTEILQPLAGTIGLSYKCVVRGVEVIIAASDYYEHKVGDRVAIVRLGDLDRFTNKLAGNFKWNEMIDMIAQEKIDKDIPSNLAYRVSTSMRIFPISFYKP